MTNDFQIGDLVRYVGKLDSPTMVVLAQAETRYRDGTINPGEVVLVGWLDNYNGHREAMFPVKVLVRV